MPVTATLSRKFYEKFGDDLTNELANRLTRWTPRIGPSCES